MNDLERAVTTILSGYMSEILATSVLRKAQAKIGVPEGRLTRQHAARLQQELSSGVRLFAPTSAQPKLLEKLRTLIGDGPAAKSFSIDVEQEADVSRARLEVRRLVLQLGGNDFQAQRAATATSELVRNIIMYAGRGRFTCEPETGPPAALHIEASDNGPGIENLPLVLSGNYRSRTGLGRGLLGVKRLADRFNAASDRKGTKIQATFQL